MNQERIKTLNKLESISLSNTGEPVGLTNYINDAVVVEFEPVEQQEPEQQSLVSLLFDLAEAFIRATLTCAIDSANASTNDRKRRQRTRRKVRQAYAEDYQPIVKRNKTPEKEIVITQTQTVRIKL